MLFIMVIARFFEFLTKKGVPVTQGFGDFTEEDTIDEGDIPLDDVDWNEVEELQRRFDEVNVLPTTEDRRISVKELIRELNGG
jgi:hypothetical protein